MILPTLPTQPTHSAQPFHENYGRVTIVGGGYIGFDGTPYVLVRDSIGTLVNLPLAELSVRADRVPGPSLSLFRASSHRESLS